MASGIRGMGICASFLVLLIGVVACGGTGESGAGPTVTDVDGVNVSPTATAMVDVRPVAPTSAPAIPTPTPPLYAPTVVGWPPEGDIIHKIGEDGHSHEPAHHYAANPSVKEQIYHSDVVVRASLVSATNDILRFRVLEYLKGVGPNEIAISASTTNRDVQYDDREAILFLKTSSGGNGNGSASFEFSEGIYDTYRNGFPSGYAINRKNRAWMPATSVVGATGSTGDTEATKFDPGAPAPGRMHDPPLTVEQIKAIITWMYAQNTVEYRECIKDVVHSENHYRDWAAYYGTLDRPEVEKEIASGSAAGAIIWHTGELFGPHYGTFSVEGEHSALFSNSYSDDDNNPRNIYSSTFATTRPLPVGHIQGHIRYG